MRTLYPFTERWLYLFFFITFVSTQCSDGTKVEEEHMFQEDDLTKIKQFKYVKEIAVEGSDSYSYDYIEDDLDSSAVEKLKEIFTEKGYKYYISNDNQFYFSVTQVSTIGAEFVISEDLKAALK